MSRSRRRLYPALAALATIGGLLAVAPQVGATTPNADLGIAVTTEQAGPTTYSPCPATGSGSPGCHQAIAGTDQVFHMTVHNYGALANAGYTATLTVAALDGTSFSFASATAGCSDTSGTTPHTVTCTDTTGLAGGGERTFDITLHIASNFTDPTNTPNNRKSTTYSAALSNVVGDQGGVEETHPDSTENQTLNADAVADLSLDKTATSNPVVAGTNEVYTLTITNHGPSNNAGFTVTDQIPPQTTFVSATASNAPSSSCSPTVDQSNVVTSITCTSPGLAYNTSETFTLTVLVASGYPDQTNLSNTGTIATINTNDPHVNDNTDTVNVKVSEVTVKRQADLGISVTSEQAGPTTYSPCPGTNCHQAVAGTDQVFHMTVHNYGPSDNSAFTATLNVAALDTAGDITYVGAKVNGGSVSNCPANTGANTVTCSDTDGLVNGGERTYDITVHIDPTFADTATDSQTTSYSAALSLLNPSDQGLNDQGFDSDPHPSGSYTLTVDAVADINVSQTAVEDGLSVNNCPGVNCPFDPTNPGNLNTVTYTVTVLNGTTGQNAVAGPSDAQNVGLTESLPAATLQTTKVEYCIGASCVFTGTPNYTNGTQVVSLGTLTPGQSKVVKFRAPLIQSLRKNVGWTGSPSSGDATATATTSASDPNTPNESTIAVNPLFTVPQAPLLQQVQPGNLRLAVQWQDQPNNGNAVLGYDVLAKHCVPATGQNCTDPNSSGYFNTIATKTFLLPPCNPPTPCDNTHVTSIGGSQFTAIVPIGQTGEGTLSNGTLYQVTVQARNAAGNSDASNGVTTTPCATCVIQLLTGNATTLNTFSTSINSGPCFPGPVNRVPTSDTAPGATSGDPVVSCFQLTSDQAAAKQGFLTALREAATGSDTGTCPTGFTCVGPANQRVSLLTPPGSGGSTQIIQTVLYDKTVAASVYGDICNKLPCASKSTIYDVFLTTPSGRQYIGSSLINGDQATGRTAWCTLADPTKPFNPDPPTPNHPQNLYQIPNVQTGQTACVVSFVHINTSQAASKINGNSPNGKNGNGDFRLDIVFEGDGGLTTCRTCR